MKGKAKCSDKWKREKIKTQRSLAFILPPSRNWNVLFTTLSILLSCEFMPEPVWLFHKLFMLTFTYSETPVHNITYYYGPWTQAVTEQFGCSHKWMRCLWSSTHLLPLFNGHGAALTTLKTANFLTHRVSTSLTCIYDAEINVVKEFNGKKNHTGS